MTLHNLQDHISWLFQNKPIPPVSLPGPTSATSAAAVEDLYAALLATRLDPEESTQPASQSSQSAAVVHVVQDFARPAVPVPVPVPVTHSAGHAEEIGTRQAMARLASASKSTRPTLVSHHQVATPASTTGSSSLTASWTASLREGSGPKPKPTASRVPSAVSNSFPPPQTPRQTPKKTLWDSPWQTPRSTRLNIEAIESVDLTGDGETSGSSPTEVFGEPQSLWCEESALRPEPLSRRAKKRKSDEMDHGRSVQRSVLPRFEIEDARLDKETPEEFMDIEAMDDDLPPPYSVLPNNNQPVDGNGSPELFPKLGNSINYEDNCRITETTSRVKARARGKLNEMPSVSASGKSYSVQSHVANKPFETSGSASSVTVVAMSPRRVDPSQQTVSPATNPKLRSTSPSINASQGHRAARQMRIIEDSDQDSENDEPDLPTCEEDKKQLKVDGPCRSQHAFTPAISSTIKSPKRMNLGHPWMISPGSISTARKTKMGTERIWRQDNSPSPFQCDSPTRLPQPPVRSDATSSPLHCSPLGAEDKELIAMYLRDPSSMDRRRVLQEYKLKEIEAAFNQSFENGQFPPTQLKLDRQASSRQYNALIALVSMREQHESLSRRKRDNLARIMSGIDAHEDVSKYENDALIINQEIRHLECQIGQFLRTAGVTRQDLGRNISGDVDAPTTSRLSSTGIDSNVNNVGISQVVLQTQMPVTRPVLAQRYQPLRTITGRYEDIDSPLPAQESHSTYLDNQTAMQRSNDRLSAFHEPSCLAAYEQSSDYGEESVPDFDDGGRVLGYEECSSLSSRKVANENWGSDDDDDDFLELAQHFDRGAFDGHRSPQTSRAVFSEVSINKSVPAKNLLVKKSKGKTTSPVASSQSELMRHPWSQDLTKALKERFHLQGFRENQLDAINATLSNKDVFVLMPTGGGKSLCYQLPAIIYSGQTMGVTIVISPLLSLMQDQVEHLQKMQIQAAVLNSESASLGKALVWSSLREAHPNEFIQLLYVTPEMISRNQKLLNTLSDLHTRNRLARIVIDEAHCVSQWGHDFRKDYKDLGQLRNRFQGVPFMALTATATENVKVDVIHNLGMTGCQVFTQSFNRPNLIYEVRQKTKKAEIMRSIADTIREKYRCQSGIIYTLSRVGCETIAAELGSQYGIVAAHYHAGLPPKEKTEVLKDWQSGKIHVMVATIAFGMGIDKPDVRFVIHHTIPKSLEGYYQETGRAGRDGLVSGCYLYYGYQDVPKLQKFIDDNEGSAEEKERQRKMLNRVIQFCENKSDCRRVQVLNYFGESFKTEDCASTCDNCRSDSVFETLDFSSVAKGALRAITQLQHEALTMSQCVDIVRGLSSRKAFSVPREHIHGYGSAPDMPRNQVERVIHRLMSEKAVAENNVVNSAKFVTQYLKPGPTSQEFLTGRRKLKLQEKVSTSPKVLEMKSAKTQRYRKGTLVAAAREGDNYPQSTNVSSPVREVSRRRHIKSPYIADEADCNDDESDDNQYEGDSFIAPDGEECSGDDGFEAVRDARSYKDRTSKKKEIGPPITRDLRMTEANLSEIHQFAVAAFVDEAKKMDEKIRNEKGIRKPLFNEQHLREMAINWTTTLQEMSEIPGVKVEQVERHGVKFIPIVKRFHAQYEDMMGHQEARDLDPSHRNVIDVVDLVSDDEDAEQGEEDNASAEGEPSRYFEPPEHVRRFNEQMAQIEADHAARSRPPAAVPKPKQRRFGSGGGGFRRASTASGTQKGGRGGKGSGAHFKSQGAASKSRVAKRKSSGSGKRVSSGSSTVRSGGSGSGASGAIFRKFAKNGGGRGGNFGGASGIGMMPT